MPIALHRLAPAYTAINRRPIIGPTDQDQGVGRERRTRRIAPGIKRDSRGERLYRGLAREIRQNRLQYRPAAVGEADHPDRFATDSRLGAQIIRCVEAV